MITNPPILVMIGHGTTGDDGIHPGNHLRWTFDRRMGFPLGGFKLYRRESLKSEVRRYCVSFSSSAGKLKISSLDLLFIIVPLALRVERE